MQRGNRVNDSAERAGQSGHGDSVRGVAKKNFGFWIADFGLKAENKGMKSLSSKSFSDNRKSKIQNRKLVGLIALALSFTFGGVVAQAQQAKKVPLIGYLAGAGSGPSSVFLQGLRDLGYVEGKNIAFVFRTTEGKNERYADLAAELVRLSVDIIVVGGNSGIRAAKKATSTIPIVMLSVGDPVGLGLVATLARPGGNITGLSQMSPDLTGKRLELLKEILLKVRVL
jgi:putative ABC transport system substrate-binding protein